MPSDRPTDTVATFPHPDDVRNYVDYLRDLGIYDLLAVPSAAADEVSQAWSALHLSQSPKAAPNAAPRELHAQPGQGKLPTAQGPDTPARPQTPATRPASPFEQAQLRRAQGSAAPQPRPGAPQPRPGAPQPRPGAPQPRPGSAPTIQIVSPLAAAAPPAPIPAAPITATEFLSAMPAPTSFNDLAPLPAERVAPAHKPQALADLRNFIGDCTRCPLAYAGRHSIVFADGDPNARLLFVGEGPGADEDEQGLPFVGKAGQLLNNMIQAMGLRREQVYIANIVKCRPPKNRTPEPVEANTCSPFLLQQIDIVQPEVIVTLGSTAATYLLGVKQSLASLRGQWFNVRGAKCAVTYHPAFLLRDPRQKGEAWKDLQRVMVELKLKPPARA